MLEKMFKLTTDAGYYLIKDHENCPNTWISIDYFESNNSTRQIDITKEDALLLGKALIDIAKDE